MTHAPRLICRNCPHSRTDGTRTVCVRYEISGESREIPNVNSRPGWCRKSAIPKQNT